jgi:hypothetical protein
MAAFPPSGERFTEDFSSLHQYQPAANMDPETGALTTDRNTLQYFNTENLNPQAPNPNTIIPQQSNTVASRTSRAAQDPYLQAEETPQRSGTLKKKNSVKRSGSRKSKAGSIRSIKMEQQEQLDVNSVFYTPVPTNNSPTELLVNRFQGESLCLLSLHSTPSSPPPTPGFCLNKANAKKHGERFSKTL